jgi:hypothetical protein
MKAEGCLVEINCRGDALMWAKKHPCGPAAALWGKILGLPLRVRR